MAHKDVTAGQNGGVDASVIGISIKTIYDALPAGFTAGVTLTLPRIGTGTGTLEDSAYAGKALRFILITASTNNDALVNGAAGWYNRSGQTAAVGKYVLAVAA